MQVLLIKGNIKISDPVIVSIVGTMDTHLISVTFKCQHENDRLEFF